MGKASSRKKQRAANECAFLSWTSTMCGGCAYRPGTEANRDVGDPELSKKRAALLMACEPFFCHEPMPAGITDPYGSHPDKRKACVGHMRALSAMRERFDTLTPAELEERRRSASQVMQAINKNHWQCECGWVVLNGAACPNPAHPEPQPAKAISLAEFERNAQAAR